MRKNLKTLSAVLVGFGLLFTQSVSKAQDLTLRADLGVAVPLTNPQAQRFDVGGAVTVKPEVGLGSYFSVGPSVSVLALPSRVAGVGTGTAWGFGGFVRFKRPHDENNTGTGLSAVSPWVDGDLKYVRTGDLARFGASLAVGASVPTSDSRWLWVGPFARYDLVNQDDGKVGFNTNSAKTAIFGLSFEFGEPLSKKEDVAILIPLDEPVQVAVDPSPEVPAAPDYEDVSLELTQVVQFPWDSPVLNVVANEQLVAVVKKLTSYKEFGSIRIEGHASSEGQVKHNDVLAQKRANSVLEFLAVNGVPRDKLSAVGFGSKVPVADNTTEVGRVANRRSSFTVKFVVTRLVTK